MTDLLLLLFKNEPNRVCREWLKTAFCMISAVLTGILLPRGGGIFIPYSDYDPYGNKSC